MQEIKGLRNRDSGSGIGEEMNINYKEKTLNIKELPDGRVCIHLLVEVNDGPIKLAGHPQLRSVTGQTADVRGKIACNPLQNSVQPQERHGQTFMCMFSNEVRAVSCPKCLATMEAIEMLSRLKEMDQNGQQGKIVQPVKVREPELAMQ